MKLTIVEAILQVLQSERRPMAAREIHDHIVRAGLYNFKAADPIQIVASQIRKHCLGKNYSSSAHWKYFEKVGDDRYYFLSSPIHQPPKGDSEIVAQAQLDSEKKVAHKELDKTAKTIEDIKRAKKTIILAIKEVMQSHGKSMTVRQIYNAIVGRDLYRFKASQPVHVVRSQIRRHCINLDFPTASNLKHFEAHGKDRYYVLPQPVRQRSTLSQIGVNTNVEKAAEEQLRSKSLAECVQLRDQAFITAMLT